MGTPPPYNSYNFLTDEHGRQMTNPNYPPHHHQPHHQQYPYAHHGASSSGTFPIPHPPSFDAPAPPAPQQPSSSSSGQQRSQQSAEQLSHHATTPRADDAAFDIFVWHPKYASCQRYFLDHAQHSGPVQAVCAFLNIHLPYQRNPPTASSAVIRPPQSPAARGGGSAGTAGASSSTAPNFGGSSNATTAGGGGDAFFTPPPSISLTPYIRRLVVTGLDFSGVLHGFFGDDWAAGVGPLHEQERRNYMFAAKSGGWGSVKNAYDMPPLETVPFLRPLQGVVEPELVAAEKSWSEFMAFEDWMIGPRAVKVEGEDGEGSGGRSPAILER